MKTLLCIVILALATTSGCKTGDSVEPKKIKEHNIELPRTAVEPLKSMETEVPFKKVLEVMDLAKLVGVQNLAIATVNNGKPVVMEVSK